MGIGREQEVEIEVQVHGQYIPVSNEVVGGYVARAIELTIRDSNRGGRLKEKQN